MEQLDIAYGELKTRFHSQVASHSSLIDKADKYFSKLRKSASKRNNDEDDDDDDYDNYDFDLILSI
jgi:hypothetical protein